jgi:hypothetical protein
MQNQKSKLLLRFVPPPLHLLYIPLPAILPRDIGKSVHIATSRFTEVKTDGSTESSDVEK